MEKHLEEENNVPDEFATKKDLDGFGQRVNEHDVRFEGHRKDIKTLRKDVDDHETLISDLDGDIHRIELGIATMRDSIINVITKRMGIYFAIATFLIAIITYLK